MDEEVPVRGKRRRPSGGKPWTPEVVRQRIKTSWIVYRLHRHIKGKLKLSATQIKAAEILLSRALPTLTQTDLSVEGSLGTYDVTDKPISADEWAKAAEDHLTSIGGSDKIQ
jgi:hypothetical protein